jgi:serine/threonine-protein kinase
MNEEGARVPDGEAEDTKVYLLAPGSRVQGRYEIVRRLSAGGMGAVYEVIHPETKRRRALKMMLPSIALNKAFRKRFKLETTVTAEIDSQHIVEIFDAGIDDDTGAPFLVMELLKRARARVDRR